ncbi:hypothetical protein ACPA0F_18090 [Solibacillus silvestris]
MTFRLTYALKNADDVFVVELATDVAANNVNSAFPRALGYIEDEHGAEALENIIGISLLVI